MRMDASMFEDVAKLKYRMSAIDLILRYLPASNPQPVTVQSVAQAQSGIDLAQQLQDLATAKQAYQANTRIMDSADELLDRLYEIQSERLRIAAAAA